MSLFMALSRHVGQGPRCPSRMQSGRALFHNIRNTHTMCDHVQRGRRFVLVRSTTSSPQPLMTARNTHRLKPLTCSNDIVGGLRNIRFNTFRLLGVWFPTDLTPSTFTHAPPTTSTASSK